MVVVVVLVIGMIGMDSNVEFTVFGEKASSLGADQPKCHTPRFGCCDNHNSHQPRMFEHNFLKETFGKGLVSRSTS